MNKSIRFISRHDITKGQIETLKAMDYRYIKTNSIVFNRLDPVDSLISEGIAEKTLAIVAPSYVVIKLLNKGYTIIEFVNNPSSRIKGKFLCLGAYKYIQKCVPMDYMGDKWDAYIETIFTKCPLSESEQEEVNLNV